MYDCIVIGGGIAGLQAAIQLGRYQHRILVIDSGKGRSTICRSYHNILGWPDGVSGETLRALGKKQAIQHGVQFVNNKVTQITKSSHQFILTTSDEQEFQSSKILLATGITDHIPDELKQIIPCLGISVYVCPDCDGYEVLNKKVIVLGSGNVGANLALTLNYWTKQIIYINHNRNEISPDIKNMLRSKGIQLINEEINELFIQNENLFTGVKLKNGDVMKGDRGFIAFGGNKVHSELAKQLGVELLENGHILVDSRTKQTNVKNVWAAGDVVAHSEQVTIAMGEGSQAAIWIHKKILEENSKES